MKKEIWKDVVGYEGIYQVSNFGHVKRIKSAKGSSFNKTMKAAPSNWGYPRLSLCKNNKSKQHLVHKLVAAAFIGNCPEGFEINHIDGNKMNANLENLEYVTSKQNSEHACKIGLMPYGTRRPTAKLNELAVKEIRELHKTGNFLQKDLAEKYNVSRRTIGDVINGKMWQHVK